MKLLYTGRVQEKSANRIPLMSITAPDWPAQHQINYGGDHSKVVNIGGEHWISYTNVVVRFFANISL